MNTLNGFRVALLLAFCLPSILLAQKEAPPLPPELQKLLSDFSEEEAADAATDVEALLDKLAEAEANYREAADYRSAAIAQRLANQFQEQGTIDEDSLQIDQITALSEKREIPARVIEIQGYHEDYLNSIGRPIAAAYVKELATLDAAYLGTGDSQGSTLIRDEAIRINSALETDPLALLPAPPELPTTTPPRLASKGKMHTLREVELVTAPEDRGDRFTVRHRGREMAIRLYFVECPPVSVQTGDPSEWADYFDISKADALAVGADAASFSQRLLNNRPFHLQTRGEKDDSGDLYAMIIIPGIGPLQRALLARGLAAPSGQSTKIGSMAGKEYATTVLRNAVAEAKKEKRGGWGFWAVTELSIAQRRYLR